MGFGFKNIFNLGGAGGGVLPLMAKMGRLPPKGVSFSGLQALDNVDLSQMSHRYFSCTLQNHCNDPLNFRSPDRSHS